MNKCCGCKCVLTPEPAGGVWYPAGESVSTPCPGGSCGCECPEKPESGDCCSSRCDSLVGGFSPDEIVGMTFNGVAVKAIYYGNSVIWDNPDSELSVSPNSVSLSGDAPVVVKVFANGPWEVEN